MGKLNATLHGDWWHYYGIIVARFDRELRGSSGPVGPAGYTIDIAPLGVTPDVLTVSGQDGTTTIDVQLAHPEHAVHWQRILNELKDASAIAREVYNEVYGRTPDQLVELYYR